MLKICAFDAKSLYSSVKAHKDRVKSMKTPTFSQSLSDARLMADAIGVHSEELLKVGLPEGTVEKLSSLVSQMNALDTKQEKLKAEQKECTAELNAKMKELNNVMADCKKRVKLAIKSELWKEFGISATK